MKLMELINNLKNLTFWGDNLKNLIFLTCSGMGRQWTGLPLLLQVHSIPLKLILNYFLIFGKLNIPAPYG